MSCTSLTIAKTLRRLIILRRVRVYKRIQEVEDSAPTKIFNYIRSWKRNLYLSKLAISKVNGIRIIDFSFFLLLLDYSNINVIDDENWTR